jgi:hypothetical protein
MAGRPKELVDGKSLCEDSTDVGRIEMQWVLRDAEHRHKGRWVKKLRWTASAFAEARKVCQHRV